MKVILVVCQYVERLKVINMMTDRRERWSHSPRLRVITMLHHTRLLASTHTYTQIYRQTDTDVYLNACSLLSD